MKATAAQLASAIARMGKGGSDVRLILLHGNDDAGAAEHAAQLGRAIGADAERIDLDGAALKANPGLLADEAASLSLFGGKRWVRVTAMGEESLEAVQLLLAAPAGGNPVVALAPTAKASGKLVKETIASPAALALACYQPEGKAATLLAADIARAHGVRLTGDTAATMFAAAGGDRAILTREIEKLALFLDAAPDRPREADAETLARISAGVEGAEIGAAVEALIGGRPDRLAADLIELDAAGTMVPTMRALAKRLIALAEMRATIDDGESPEVAVERHRVFFRERDSTVRLLRSWSSPQIAQALARVRRAERGIMSGGGAGVTGAHELVTLARAAARRG
jgi:DNA polymerase III subunit delta